MTAETIIKTVAKLQDVKVAKRKIFRSTPSAPECFRKRRNMLDVTNSIFSDLPPSWQQLGDFSSALSATLRRILLYFRGLLVETWLIWLQNWIQILKRSLSTLNCQSRPQFGPYVLEPLPQFQRSHGRPSITAHQIKKRRWRHQHWANWSYRLVIYFVFGRLPKRLTAYICRIGL